MESNKLIDLIGIHKSYGNSVVIDDLNLYIRENEFLTLLGPSGCGKTTTLRIIGGFETPDAGKVIFNGKDITKLPPNERQLNTVFQKYALFTHMTIAENIAFGLKIKKKSKAYIHDKIKYALKLVNLDGFENRMPESLSGGQQQRIAIARAIVNEPKVLLLDEPLGALDLKMRQDMQYELIRLKNELGITFVYVTHDQEEALTLSDRIAVFNKGIIEQVGTPREIYNQSKTEFVCNFIGDINHLEKETVEEVIKETGANLDPDKESYIRLERVNILKDKINDKYAILSAEILSFEYYGLYIKYYLKVGNSIIKSIEKETGQSSYNVGEKVKVCLNPADIMQY